MAPILTAPVELLLQQRGRDDGDGRTGHAGEDGGARSAVMAGARSQPGGSPALAVVVDTEEEFDWLAPFDRASVGVGHMRQIGRLQAVCERWGIRPVYVADYPIVTQEAGIEALRPLVREGRAFVGAHLHPWVSPPFEEEVNGRNSFPGNLPAALERAKLAGLCEAIEAAFGTRPAIYKAGRYGLGANSFAILEDLGFTVDVSPSPPFDYRYCEGPDFSRRGLAPEWAGPRGSVLSIPGTGALIGRVPSSSLYQVAASPRLERLHLRGLLAHLGAVERIKLSPEGHSCQEMIRLVRWLFARGQRLFVMSLHSPSVEPGHTPYVRSDDDLNALLNAVDGFFRFFMTELGGVPTDPLAVRASYAGDGEVRPTPR